jgi:hypothetical protein
MKFRLTLVLLLVLAIPFALTLHARAATTSGTAAPATAATTLTADAKPNAKANTGAGISDNGLTATTDATNSTPSVAVQVEKVFDDDASISRRVALREAGFVNKIDAAAQLKVAQKCTAAQPKVKKIKDANELVTTDRITAYSQLLTQINDILTRAQAQKLKTADLQTAYTSLDNKVISLEQSMRAYRETLVDLTAMNCKDDPVGFKATLEDARSNQTNVVNAIKELRDFLTTTVKPAVEALKTQVASTGGQ